MTGHNLFDEPAFRQRVLHALDCEGNDAAVAKAAQLQPATISRLRKGKGGIRNTETYFRLMRWLTGEVPPQ